MSISSLSRHGMSGSAAPSTNAEFPDAPRTLAKRSIDDRLTLLGAAAGSLALVWLLFERVLPFSGAVGFTICWYVAFVGFFTGLTAMAHPRPIVIDRLAQVVIAGGAAAVGFALLATVVFTFVRGWRPLTEFNFYVKDMHGVAPTDPVTRGGVLHAIVGSGIELGIAVIVALPLGIGTAVYMSEVGGRFARVVRTVVEAMTALPDLLAGLFVYTTLLVGLGLQRSGLAAAIALAITMLPIIARSAELALRVVPGGLREAGVALGSTRWRTVWRIVLPTAAPGLATALILAFARAAGETAPVLIVSGASSFLNLNPVSNPMNSLPLFIYDGFRSGQPRYIERGFGAACLLLMIVLVVFVVLRLLARGRVGKSR